MAKKSSGLQPEKIHLIKYQLVSGKLENRSGVFKLESEGVKIGTDFNMAFDLENRIVKSDIKVRYSAAGDDGQPVSADYHFSFFFKTENLDSLIAVKDENEITVDTGLGNAIASITYSTTRGLLMARLQGTIFENYFLPVINPNDLLQTDTSSNNKE